MKALVLCEMGPEGRPAATSSDDWAFVATITGASAVYVVAGDQDCLDALRTEATTAALIAVTESEDAMWPEVDDPIPADDLAGINVVLAVAGAAPLPPGTTPREAITAYEPAFDAGSHDISPGSPPKCRLECRPTHAPRPGPGRKSPPAGGVRIGLPAP